MVALDVRGKSYTTEALARQLGDWLAGARAVALLIGGPDGLAPDCLKRADARWSLSPLTFPHELVRVLITEQLYRALCIRRRIPYHK